MSTRATRSNRVWDARREELSREFECSAQAISNLEVYSRRVVGGRWASRLVTPLMLNALDMALGQRDARDVTYHSDNGYRCVTVLCHSALSTGLSGDLSGSKGGS